MSTSRYGPADERKEIWVYLEKEGEAIEPVSLEILSKGRELADSVNWQLACLLIGNNLDPLSLSAQEHGADRIYLVEHPLCEQFTIDTYAQAAFQVITRYQPSVVLLGATYDGRDLAARLAVRLRTGLNADCTNLSLKPPEGVLVSEVSGFGGGILASIQMPGHRPQMATVRPGVFQSQKIQGKGHPEVIRVPIEIKKETIRTRIIERNKSTGVDLTKTHVLIAAGRGVGSDHTDIKALTGSLNGELGATRPVVDMGLIERERQIGQTGVACSPKLAICCGISGAFHFVVGIEKAETVIAINSDPDAPIFENADYCIVGDVHKVIPALLQALQSAGENSRV